MTPCLIGLGSNQGDRLAALRRAIARLRAHPRVHRLRSSHASSSQPIGGPLGQGEFLNACAWFSTSLAPLDLLRLLQEIEREAGRKPGERWAARPLDLDLLLYGELVLDDTLLRLPHPRMTFRRFVLEPAAEVAPDMLHPTTGWTVAALESHLHQSSDYAAVAGPHAESCARMVRQLSRAGGLRRLHADPDDDQLAAICRRSAGPDCGLPLEFLARRAETLHSGSWPSDGAATLGDFSFDLTLAIGNRYLPPAARAAWHRGWEELRRGVAAPRLLVFWNPLAVETGDGVETGDELYAVELRRVLGRYCQGPRLTLDGVSTIDARREVQAALEAMRSPVVMLPDDLG